MEGGMEGFYLSHQPGQSQQVHNQGAQGGEKKGLGFCAWGAPTSLDFKGGSFTDGPDDELQENLGV